MDAWARELRSAARDVRPCSGVQTDFGGKPSEASRFRVTTRDLDEVLRVFDVAGRHRVAIATLGAGHSSGQHTAAPGGIALRHAPPSGEVQMDGDVAVVPAHLRWDAVEVALRARGRDLPVATSSLDTTVAGTLSMGGFGVRSPKRGGQVDHVEALRLVQMDGRVTWCSSQERPALFHSVLTGVGQVGWIEQARIRTVRHQPHLACRRDDHANYRELARSVLWMSDADVLPDYFAALGKQGRIESIVATAHDSEAAACSNVGTHAAMGGPGSQCSLMTTAEFEAGEREMPLEYWRTCRNLWCDYCLDGPGFVRFAELVDEHRAELERHLVYVMCLAPRSGQPLPLDMRPPSDRRLFSVGLFFGVPRDDAPTMDRALAIHAEALELCLELGGRPYLHGQWGGRRGLPARVLARVFGTGYETLCAERRRADPHGVLNPSALDCGFPATAPA